MKTEILSILKTQKYVSGQKIAEILGISRSAVHKHIQKLRSAGYVISGEKNLGYSIISRPDIISAEEIEEQLNILKINNYKILFYPSLPSTQTIAKKLSENGAKHGTIVTAETQSESYGRMKRKWFSPSGGIWFSLILRPDMLPEKIPQITLLMCLAVCRAIERTLKIALQIKWPNDIVFEGRKLAGILTEMSAEVGKVNWVISGVGLNVNNEIPLSLNNTAASLFYISGNKSNRSTLLADIIFDFDILYKEFCSHGFKGMEEEYNKRSTIIGKAVSVSTGDKGYACKIDSDGYLWLTQDNGTLKKIIAGDISIVNEKQEGSI